MNYVSRVSDYNILRYYGPVSYVSKSILRGEPGLLVIAIIFLTGTSFQVA